MKIKHNIKKVYLTKINYGNAVFFIDFIFKSRYNFKYIEKFMNKE